MKDTGFPFPIISDKKRDLAVSLGMIDPEEKDKDGLPLTCRAVWQLISFFILIYEIKCEIYYYMLM